MKKLALFLLVGLSGASASPFILNLHSVCKQDWERCKQYKQGLLDIQERHLERKRACLQTATDSQSYRECVLRSRKQAREEIRRLKESFRNNQ